MPAVVGISLVALATARATATSVAGSTAREPPTVETYTSRLVVWTPKRACSTANVIANLDESTPDVVRRACGVEVGEVSAWISMGIGRRPSSVTVTQVPGTGWRAPDRKRPLGSGREWIPDSVKVKQPTSSVGPYRFFNAR